MPEEVRVKAELTVVLVFFLALAGIGAFVGGYAVQDFARARASKDWPAIEAVVLSASNKDRAMRYAYVVGGRSYESRRTHFFVGKFSHGLARDFTPGETVRVLVDPEDPALSVVRGGGSGIVFLVTLAIAGLLLFFGIGGLIRTLMMAHAEGRIDDFEGGEADAA